MIRDRSEELGTFHARHFAEPMGKHPASTNGHHSELTDEEVIELARSAKNAAKFEALWEGDTSGYASHSEADQALISLLAFYTQDESQLDSLYQAVGPVPREVVEAAGLSSQHHREGALQPRPIPTHPPTMAARDGGRKRTRKPSVPVPVPI